MASVGDSSSGTHHNFKGQGFCVQFKALFRKNLSYQGRQTLTNVCQIFVPVLLIGLLILIQETIGKVDENAVVDTTSCQNKSWLEGFGGYCAPASVYKVKNFELRYQQQDNRTGPTVRGSQQVDEYLVNADVKFAYSAPSSADDKLGKNVNSLPKELLDWYLRLRTEGKFAQSCGFARSQCYELSLVSKAPKWAAAAGCDEVLEVLEPCNQTFDHPALGETWETCYYGDCEDAKCKCQEGYSGPACRTLQVSDRAAGAVQSNRPDGCKKDTDIWVEDIENAKYFEKFHPVFCAGRYSTHAFDKKTETKFDAVAAREFCVREKAWCDDFYTKQIWKVFEELPTGYSGSDTSKIDDIKSTLEGFLGHIEMPFNYFEDTTELGPLISKTIAPSSTASTDAKNNAYWVYGNLKLFRQLEFIYFDGDAGVKKAILDRWGKADEQLIGAFDITTKDSDGNLAYKTYLNQTSGFFWSSAYGTENLQAFITMMNEGMFMDQVPGSSWSSMAACVRQMPAKYRTFQFDFITFLAVIILWYIVGFQSPVYTMQLVYEKEHKMRQIMRMSGLSDSTYWVVNFITHFTMYMVLVVVTIGIMFGIMRLQMFTRIDFSIWVVLLLLFGVASIMHAWFLASLFTKSQTAVVCAFLLWFVQLLLSFVLMFSNAFNGNFTVGLSMLFNTMPFLSFMQFTFYAGITVVFDGVITWDDVYLGGGGTSGKLPLGDCLLAMFVHIFAYFFLMLYLDAVFGPDQKGFCFCCGRKSKVVFSRSGDNEVEEKYVEEERRIAEDDAQCDKNEYVIRIRNLRKVYALKSGCNPLKWFRCGGGDADEKGFTAVHDLSMGVKQGECFGMLGPNGAGKTTTINMLCGMFQPTSGKAELYRKDLVDDIRTIQKTMGVCPQHDLLWGSLTGQEHMLFYGRLRGLSGTELETEVRRGLADVSLTFAAKKMSKQYSGGMKRRLSVACALIGKPAIVYLDEPSTGLDPASRRKLWDVIRRASADCAMILTTHSMEEADALCDRITIMAAGKLRCIGSGALLKTVYSEGYKFSVSCNKEDTVAANAFVRNQVFANAPEGAIKQLNSLAGTTNYTINNDVVESTTLSKVFKTMEESKSGKTGVKISDWGISEGTLEEVFASITKKVVQSGQTKTEEELQAEKEAAHKAGMEQTEFAGAPGFSSWFSAMPVHTWWLMKKNVKIYQRNTSATGFLVFSGVIIMCMLRLLQELQGSGGGDQIYVGVEDDPAVNNILPVQTCTPHKWDDCRSLIVYKPGEAQYSAGSAMDGRVDNVIKKIIKNNDLPGIDEKKGVEVRRYDTENADWLKDINAEIRGKWNYSKLMLIIPQDFGHKIGPVSILNTSAPAYTTAKAQATRAFGYNNQIEGNCKTDSTTFKFECKANYQFQILHNWTLSCGQFNILGCDNPRESLIWPLTQAMQHATFQEFGDKPDAAWKTTWSVFPHGDLTWRFQRSIVNAYVPRFGMTAVIFMFVVQLGLIVREKQFKLREALKMIGTKDAAYWISWIFVNAFMVFLGTALMIAMALLIELKPITVTDWRVTFMIFFTFAISMIGLSFIVSTVLGNAQSATLLGFAFFLIAYLLTDLVGSIYDSTAAENVPWQQVLKFISPAMFLRATTSMCRDTVVSGSGVRWDCAGAYGCTDIYNDKTFFPIIECINWIVYDTIIYFLLGWYIDKVKPSEYGSAEPLYFFLSPFWWCGMTNSESEPAPYREGEEKENLDGKPEEKDVEDRCKSTLQNDYSGAFVEIKRLKKVFGGGPTIGCFQPQALCCQSEDLLALLCCCCCHPYLGIPYPICRTKKFHAVKGVSYVIPDNELFCLLGPNGAGKTTTINMMTGLHPQTSGQIKVDGMSVKTQMKAVRKIMGCCPQHDILWNELTAGEHVELFARLKGVKVGALKEEVISRLGAVDLVAVKDRQAGAYSGGMLRRLSVTLSLTGDPKIAYMDEPTTGMDPVSRRHVWDLIEKCKKGRTILLTTHSMEEADVLGNTIAIMGKGRLRAFGTSLHLKNVFGAGYQFIFTCEPGNETDVKNLIKEADPHMELLDVKQKSIIFRHALDDEDGSGTKLKVLCEFLSRLEKNKAEFKVNDFSIAMTTLEEVFLALCKSDEEIEMGQRVSQLQLVFNQRQGVDKSMLDELEALADSLGPLLTPAESDVLVMAQKLFQDGGQQGGEQGSAMINESFFNLKKLVPTANDIPLTKAVSDRNLAILGDGDGQEIVTASIPFCGRLLAIPIHRATLQSVPDEGMVIPGQLTKFFCDPISASETDARSAWNDFEQAFVSGKSGGI